MTTRVRQLIKKGDPRLSVHIPKIIKDQLINASKIGKRRLQDEVIRRLAATINNKDAYNTLNTLMLKKIKF